MTTSKDGQLGQLRRETVEKLLAIRERWHVKNHPLYLEFAAGKLGLKPLAALLAQQYHHIRRVLPSLGLEFYKAPDEERGFILRQLMVEGGFATTDEAGEPLVSSMEMCLRFCRLAGYTDEQVKSLEPLTVWRARAYFYLSISHEESFGIYIAMKSITEGMQTAINRERVLPALEKFHGYKPDHPSIRYFNSQFIADPGVGDKMLEFAAKLLDSPSQQRHGLEVAETAAKYYWQAASDIYRTAVLGQADLMPPGAA